MFKLSAVLSVLWSFDVPCGWRTRAYASFMAFHILASLHAVDSLAFSYKQSRFGRGCWGLVLGLVRPAGTSRATTAKRKAKESGNQTAAHRGLCCCRWWFNKGRERHIWIWSRGEDSVRGGTSDASSGGWQCRALVLASAALLDNPSNENILIS